MNISPTSHTRISLAFNWKQLGQVSLGVNKKLDFPCMSLDKPCVYRIDIKGSKGCEVYIGEAVKYNQRMRGYQSPGPTQRTNQRMNDNITEALQSNGLVSVLMVADGAHLCMNGEDRLVDMTEKHQRVLIENAALCEAYTSGLIVLNK